MTHACKTLFLLFAAALAAPADTFFKDRLRFEAFPREVEENQAVIFKATLQGKWKYGWCAVTLPDGTTKNFEDAVEDGGRVTQELKFVHGKGRYVVEFLVQGELGPAVGAIIHMFAGVPAEVVEEPDYKWDTRPADEIERDVFERINKFREERKLPRLAWEEKFAVVGREHCADMIENKFFAHVSPTAGNMAARAKTKYGWKNVVWGLPDRLYPPTEGGPVFIGEDLAYDNHPGAAVDAWLGSPGHRAALLNKNVTLLGVGVRKHEFNEGGFHHRRIYFVAAFGLIADTGIDAAEGEAKKRAAEAAAQPAFEKAQELEALDMPKAVEAYEVLAGKHGGTEFAARALARAKELKEHPEWPRIVAEADARREARGWLERARMLIKNERPDSARAWLEKVRESHPGTPEAEEAKRLMKSLEK